MWNTLTLFYGCSSRLYSLKSFSSSRSINFDWETERDLLSSILNSHRFGVKLNLYLPMFEPEVSHGSKNYASEALRWLFDEILWRKESEEYLLFICHVNVSELSSLVELSRSISSGINICETDNYYCHLDWLRLHDFSFLHFKRYWWTF